MNEYEKLIAELATRIYATGQFTVRQSVNTAMEIYKRAKIRCAEENEAIRT